jgi:hypothetical protein
MGRLDGGAVNSTRPLGRAFRFKGKPRPRRVPIELLAGCGHEGCAEAVLKAHGASPRISLSSLVRAGLATATSQRVRAGRERMEVAVLQITDAGRQALAKAER